MTTLQLNAQLLRALGEIADDKDIVKQVLDFVNGFVEKKRQNAQAKQKQKTLDSTKKSKNWLKIITFNNILVLFFYYNSLFLQKV